MSSTSTVLDAAPRPLLAGRRTMFGLLLATAIAGSGLLAACATLLGPRTIEVPRQELLDKMGRRFPLTQRVMHLLDVTASLPTLDLQGDRNRILAGVDLSAHELVMGQSYSGRVAMSFGLRYEPRDLTLRLTDPRVEQVELAGLPPAYQRALTGMAATLVEDSLKDYPVHQFKPEDLRAADRMGYEVHDIAVTSTGLAVHLVPRP